MDKLYSSFLNAAINKIQSLRKNIIIYYFLYYSNLIKGILMKNNIEKIIKKI